VGIEPHCTPDRIAGALMPLPLPCARAVARAKDNKDDWDIKDRKRRSRRQCLFADVLAVLGVLWVLALAFLPCKLLM